MMKLFPAVSESSIKRIHRLGRDDPSSIKLETHRVGRCGRTSKLTPELRVEFTRIAQEYANMWIRLTYRLAQEELSQAGFHLSLRTIGKHFKLMKQASSSRNTSFARTAAV